MKTMKTRWDVFASQCYQHGDISEHFRKNRLCIHRFMHLMRQIYFVQCVREARYEVNNNITRRQSKEKFWLVDRKLVISTSKNGMESYRTLLKAINVNNSSKLPLHYYTGCITKKIFISIVFVKNVYVITPYGENFSPKRKPLHFGKNFNIDVSFNISENICAWAKLVNIPEQNS